jgi:hypothetical protein
MRRTIMRGLGALVLAIGVGFVVPGSGAAEEINVIRPTDTRPELRIDVVGSLVKITHVENARQADAVFFQGEKSRYQRDANDPQAKPYGLFLTYSVDGREAFIVLDLAWLQEEDNLGFVDLMLFDTGGTPVRNVPGTHESVQLSLQPLEDGTYRARQYEKLPKGSKVNNTDWGIQEGYTTRNDSINARVDNGPDDDEARNQGDYFDNKGRRVSDDDR